MRSSLRKLVVEDGCLAVREDHPLLEVVNAHASHGTLKGSRFSRRVNGGVPRITFAIACFSEDLRGPSLWSSQAVSCVSSLRSMLVENSHAQIRPCNVTLRRRVLPYPVDRTKRDEAATPFLDLRAHPHAYLRGDATSVRGSCTCP